MSEWNARQDLIGFLREHTMLNRHAPAVVDVLVEWLTRHRKFLPHDPDMLARMLEADDGGTPEPCACPLKNQSPEGWTASYAFDHVEGCPADLLGYDDALDDVLALYDETPECPNIECVDGIDQHVNAPCQHCQEADDE